MQGWVHGDAVATPVRVAAAGDLVDVRGHGRAEDDIEESPVRRDGDAFEIGE